MNPPRKYLSYSSFTLWKRSREAWHRYYIDGQGGFTNDAMEFGSRFDKAVEDDEETGDLEIDFGLLHIPTYPKRQYEMKADLRATRKENSLVILGKFDGYWPQVPKIGEVKTGTTKWTQKMVNSFGQLTFYALVHYLKKKKIPELALHHYNQHTKESKTFTTKRTLAQLMKLAGEIIKVNQQIVAYCKNL